MTISTEYMDLTTKSDRFVSVKDVLASMRANKNHVEKQLMESKVGSKTLKKRYDNALKARKVIQKVAQDTQQELEYHVSNLVTMAEHAIFDDPYNFEIEFVQRRNKTECDLWFSRNDVRQDPMSSAGGGALDVASFALRCSFWALNRTRPVIVLDEPFKFLSRDLQEKASQMIKSVSEKLHIQFIIVSHIDELIGSADKIFRVQQGGDGVSEVIEVLR